MRSGRNASPDYGWHRLHWLHLAMRLGVGSQARWFFGQKSDEPLVRV